MRTYLTKEIIPLALVLSACADLSDPSFDSTFTDKSGNSQPYYSCITATMDSNGAWWSYETNAVSGAMSEIKLSVSRDDTSFGTVILNKISDRQFSNGNLSLTLVPTSGGRSIEVDHQQTGLFAKSANGWCRQITPEGSTPILPTSQTNEGVDRFQLKVDSSCESPCSFGLETNLNIDHVGYEANGYYLGQSTDSRNDFYISYSFNTSGARTLTVIGYDAYGNRLATDQRTVQVNIPNSNTTSAQSTNSQPTTSSTTSSSSASVSRNSVPYYYQYNNQLSPSASCQNTSIAMVLSFLGANVRPDDVTSRFGKDLAQSVTGLNRVYNTLANEKGVRGLHSNSAGSFAQLHAALDRGEPAIIHGFFTGYGHVVVVTGYDAGGYYVNDPAGRWSQTFQGGYPNAWNEPSVGHNIYYSKRAFEAAVGTSDGSTPLALWLHTLR